MAGFGECYKPNFSSLSRFNALAVKKQEIRGKLLEKIMWSKESGSEPQRQHVRTWIMMAKGSCY